MPRESWRDNRHNEHESKVARDYANDRYNREQEYYNKQMTESVRIDYRPPGPPLPAFQRWSGIIVGIIAFFISKQQIVTGRSDIDLLLCILVGLMATAATLLAIGLVRAILNHWLAFGIIGVFLWIAMHHS